MRQQDYLAQYGKIHHYKTDQVLRWIQDRFEDGRLKPHSGHEATLQSLRSSIRKLPEIAKHLELTKSALALVLAYQEALRPSEYSSMYAVLESALRDCGCKDIRSVIKSA